MQANHRQMGSPVQGDVRRTEKEVNSAFESVLEAERTLFATLFLDAAAYPELRDRLTSEHFYDPRHQHMWGQLGHIYDEHGNLDISTVVFGLKSHLEYVGGLAYLDDISNRFPATSMPGYHAGLIEDAYRQRCIYFTAEAVRDESALATNSTHALGLLLDAAKQEEERAVVKDESLKTSLNETMELIVKCQRGQAGRVHTGIEKVDEKLILMPPDFLLLAGRPSTGKTAASLGVAEALCEAGKGVGLVSLEMEKSQLLMRMLARISGVPTDQMRREHGIPDEGFSKLAHAAETMYKWPLYIDDSSGMTVEQLRVLARGWKRKHDIKLLIIDYFGLLNAEGKWGSREEELAHCSKQLKKLCKDLEIPIWCLVQMNRSIEQRATNKNPNPRPNKADLRDTGQLEQDADAILFLWKPDPDDDNAVTWIIDKQRQGQAPWDINLRFNKQRQTFTDSNAPRDWNDE